MSFTAALAAQMLGAGRRLRIALWTWLAVTTVGTVYLGWHYFLDDIAGVAMGAAALGLARLLTGVDIGAARRERRAGERDRDLGWTGDPRRARTPVPAGASSGQSGEFGD
jgi:membrane-associated phospholipid phosphatase